MSTAKAVGLVIAFFILITVLNIAGCLIGLVGGAGDNAAKVVKQEFYPDALLRKYEYFKDVSAALDKKQADIRIYEVKFNLLASEYKGVPRRQWAREDREQWAMWASEVAGIKASYNTLAAEYNAQMSKFNWRFTNVGDLPPGAVTPLPREVKPYEVQ